MCHGHFHFRLSLTATSAAFLTSISGDHELKTRRPPGIRTNYSGESEQHANSLASYVRYSILLYLSKQQQITKLESLSCMLTR